MRCVRAGKRSTTSASYSSATRTATAGLCSSSPRGVDIVEVPTADAFVAALHRARCRAELPRIEKRLGPGDEAIGIRMRDLFDAAKAAMRMPLGEVESLLASPLYEVRMGAFCILDFRAKAPRTDDAERKQLCDLYLGHHDRITTW